ncbi:MAG: NAD-dependent epimerase/dehydratase family protein [Mariniblastus sp.]
MRILITGATGFLGNNLVRALLKQNHDVVAAIRHSSDLKALDGLEIETVHVNLNDASEVAMVLSDVDVVIHSAAMIQVGWTKLAASRKINVEATAIIAEASRRKKVRMIHVSSVDALGMGSEREIVDETKLDPPKPACSYVVSKREAESAVILEVANGLDAVIVNPGFMVGPHDWKPSSGEMMLTLYKSFIFFAPAGGCSVVDVRDVADGIISAIENGRQGERYILGGENMTYFDLWTMMAAVMDSRKPKKVLPDWIANAAGKTGDLMSRFLSSEPTVNSAATQMGQMFHYYSSEKAKQDLGYKIGSVEDGIRDAWDWFVLNGYTKK